MPQRFRGACPLDGFSSSARSAPFLYSVSPPVAVPGRGALQKGAECVSIISHEEHVIWQQRAGNLAYITPATTERSSNLFKVTQFISC